jgi:transposase
MVEDPGKSQERLSAVLEVLAGNLTVKKAAQQLGISRKSYYEWQERALRAMRDALTDRQAGRPALPVDAEKEQLRQKVEELSDRLVLAEKTIEVKNILTAYAAQQKSLSGASVKPGKKKP